MDVTAPSWLNLDFVQDVLRRSEVDNSIEVLDIFTKTATNKGDNYASDMVRVHVNFTRKQGDHDVTQKMSIVVKLAPDEGARKDIIASFGVFEKEINMMTHTLPKMNEMLGNKHRISARALYVKKDVPSFLVIEDLAPLGYRMADREAGLDLEHCVMAIRNIARFHASSVVLCEKEPHHKDLYQRGMFHKEFRLLTEFSTFFENGIMSLALEAETWPELGKTYADKLKVFAKKVYDWGIEAVTRDDDEFNVITHGDCWVNNMMFRCSEDGKLLDHIFVDFQISSYTSPAIDLLYFLNASACSEVYNTKKEYLLDEYLSKLTSTLSELGYKGEAPTMAELKKAMDKRAAYALITAFTVLPIVLAEKTKIQTVDEMLADGFKHPAYKNELYRKVITNRILNFDKIGLLDRYQ